MLYIVIDYIGKMEDYPNSFYNVCQEVGLPKYANKEIDMFGYSFEE